LGSHQPCPGAAHVRGLAASARGRSSPVALQWCDPAREAGENSGNASGLCSSIRRGLDTGRSTADFIARLGQRRLLAAPCPPSSARHTLVAPEASAGQARQRWDATPLGHSMQADMWRASSARSLSSLTSTLDLLGLCNQTYNRARL